MADRDKDEREGDRGGPPPVSTAIERGLFLSSPVPVGHASAAMTLDVYAGLFGDDLDAVADRLDEAAALARADYLRTEPPSDAVLPFDLGGRAS